MVMIDYIIILLLTYNANLIWELSSLKTKISQLFLKQELLPEEFDNYMIDNHPFWGSLLSCQLCYSTWLAFGFGWILVAFGAETFIPFLSMFTIPSIVYTIYVSRFKN